MTSFKSTSLADKVFEKLENDIIFGVYPRGEILTELKLVEQLGVSRTPIREALRRLEEGVGDEAPEEAEDEPNREPDYLTVHVEAEPGPLVLRRIVYRGAPDLLEFTLPSGSVYEFPFREALALLRPVVG